MKRFKIYQGDINLLSTDVTEPTPIYSPSLDYIDGDRVQHDDKIWEVWKENISERATMPVVAKNFDFIQSYGKYTHEIIFRYYPSISSRLSSSYLDGTDTIAVTILYSRVGDVDKISYIERTYTRSKVIETTTAQGAVSYTTTGLPNVTLNEYPSEADCPVGGYYSEASVHYKKIAKVGDSANVLYFYSVANQYNVFDGHSDTYSGKLGGNMTWNINNPAFSHSILYMLIVGGDIGEDLLIGGVSHYITNDIMLIPMNIQTQTLQITYSGEQLSEIAFITDEIDIALNTYEITTTETGQGKINKLVGGRAELRVGEVTSVTSVNISYSVDDARQVRKDLRDTFHKKSLFQLGNRDSSAYSTNRLDIFRIGTITKRVEKTQDDHGVVHEVINSSFQIVDIV